MAVGATHGWWSATTSSPASTSEIDPGSIWGAAASKQRRDVAAVANAYRVDQVLVQVVDVLDPAMLGRAPDRNEVEYRQVLDPLAQADLFGVRAHRNTKFLRE